MEDLRTHKDFPESDVLSYQLETLNNCLSNFDRIVTLIVDNNQFHQMPLLDH
jgi:hypothetical protein